MSKSKLENRHIIINAFYCIFILFFKFYSLLIVFSCDNKKELDINGTDKELEKSINQDLKKNNFDDVYNNDKEKKNIIKDTDEIEDELIDEIEEENKIKNKKSNNITKKRKKSISPYKNLVASFNEIIDEKKGTKIKNVRIQAFNKKDDQKDSKVRKLFKLALTKEEQSKEKVINIKHDKVNKKTSNLEIKLKGFDASTKKEKILNRVTLNLVDVDDYKNIFIYGLPQKKVPKDFFKFFDPTSVKKNINGIRKENKNYTNIKLELIAKINDKIAFNGEII